MEVSNSKITSFSVRNPEIVLPFHYLLTDLLHDIADAAVENASSRAIYKAIRATKSSQTGFLEISLKSMIEHLNPRGIASALIRVEEQIKTEIITSESIVGAERKKLNIFRSEKKPQV